MSPKNKEKVEDLSRGKEREENLKQRKGKGELGSGEGKRRGIEEEVEQWK